MVTAELLQRKKNALILGELKGGLRWLETSTVGPDPWPEICPKIFFQVYSLRSHKKAGFSRVIGI